MKKGSIEENLVEYSDEELNAIKDVTDWKCINRMTDENINAASEDASLTEEELDQFEPVMYVDGVEIKIVPIEPDILEWFKKHDPDYLGQINTVLRAHIETEEAEHVAVKW